MKRAHNFQDLTGQKIHRLTFLEYVGKNDSRNSRWKVQCDCGTIFEVTASSVKSGTTYSCGCLRKERCKSGFKKFLNK